MLSSEELNHLFSDDPDDIAYYVRVIGIDLPPLPTGVVKNLTSAQFETLAQDFDGWYIIVAENINLSLLDKAEDSIVITTNTALLGQDNVSVIHCDSIQQACLIATQMYEMINPTNLVNLDFRDLRDIKQLKTQANYIEETVHQKDELASILPKLQQAIQSNSQSIKGLFLAIDGKDPSFDDLFMILEALTGDVDNDETRVLFTAMVSDFEGWLRIRVSVVW